MPLGGETEQTGSHKGYGYGMLCEIFTSILSGGLTSNHTHIGGKGGTCHGFIAINPEVFGSADEIREHLSTFLTELRESPKAEGQERIYTHGEKEVFAYKDRMENGINVNIGTVAEMVDLCKYLDMNVVDYLGEEALELTLTKSSYDM